MAIRVHKLDVVTDIADLEAGLAIDELALEEAHRNQPDLFYKVAKRLALEISRRDAAKRLVDETEAAVEVELREAADDDDKKVTDKRIQAMVTSHPDVREAHTKYHAAREIVGQLSALKESFEQRSWALKELVALHLGAYYSDVDVRARMGREGMQRERMRRGERE